MDRIATANELDTVADRLKRHAQALRDSESPDDLDMLSDEVGSDLDALMAVAGRLSRAAEASGAEE